MKGSVAPIRTESTTYLCICGFIKYARLTVACKSPAVDAPGGEMNSVWKAFQASAPRY